jgi:hypothetical protein
MNTLPVSYVSQLGLDADYHSNDCGAASSLMLLRTYGLSKTETVNHFFDEAEPTGDVGLYVGVMQFEMAERGLKNEWKGNLVRGDVFTYLSNKKPLLALIHYAPLVNAKVTQFTSFGLAHFITITGADLDSYFINDPYRNDGKTNVAVPITVFEQAWAQANIDMNPVGGAIIPLLPIQDLSTLPPATDEYKLLVNGLYVRSLPSGTSTLLRTIWKTITPTIHVLAETLNNGYVRLSDGSGWVWMAYIQKI